MTIGNGYSVEIQYPEPAIPETATDSGYRLLKRGDVVQATDEEMVKGHWVRIPKRHVGWILSTIRRPRRRRVTQTAKGLMDDLQQFAGFTLVPGPIKQHTLAPSSESANSLNTSTGVEIRSKPFQPIAQSPDSPKPFTPNKYTRYVPTLDGRRVPVDVYCISEAFPLTLASEGAKEAVLHARKKLLAPGQRGTKSAIQDIREARDSLTRAIEIEEALIK